MVVQGLASIHTNTRSRAIGKNIVSCLPNTSTNSQNKMLCVTEYSNITLVVDKPV